jgi:hypothetical protein
VAAYVDPVSRLDEPSVQPGVFRPAFELMDRELEAGAD